MADDKVYTFRSAREEKSITASSTLKLSDHRSVSSGKGQNKAAPASPRSAGSSNLSSDQPPPKNPFDSDPENPEIPSRPRPTSSSSPPSKMARSRSVTERESGNSRRRNKRGKKSSWDVFHRVMVKNAILCIFTCSFVFLNISFMILFYKEINEIIILLYIDQTVFSICGILMYKFAHGIYVKACYLCINCVERRERKLLFRKKTKNEKMLELVLGVGSASNNTSVTKN